MAGPLLCVAPCAIAGQGILVRVCGGRGASVDLNDVLLPGPDEARGNLAFEAWKDLGTASMLEATAINSLERAILSATTYSR